MKKTAQRRSQKTQYLADEAQKPPQEAAKTAAREGEIQPHPQQKKKQHVEPELPAAGARAQAKEGGARRQAEEQVQQRGQQGTAGAQQGKEIVDEARRGPAEQGEPCQLQLQQRGCVRHPKRREKRLPRSARPSS